MTKLWSALSLFLVIASAAAQSCSQATYGTFVPHEYNCEHFYECFGSERVERECPAGRYFDYYQQGCDESIPAGCVINGNPTYCYNAGHMFLPNPYDCSRYIECYNGQYYDLQCPGGLHFNTITEVCQDPQTAACTAIAAPPPVTSVCYGVSAGRIVLKPYAGLCEYYYRCVGSEVSLHQCPSGMYFNAPENMCDFIAYVPCTDVPGTPLPDSVINQAMVPVADPRCAAGSYALYAHPAICNKYILCTSGAGYEVDCPVGMYFREDYHNCVDPYYATCAAAITPPPPVVTPPPGVQISPDCIYPIGDGRLLPFPGDCTKFYECAEGIKVEMDCPAGLWWHQAIGGCDYPYLSACIARTAVH